jgi:hypothetical protein
MARCEAVTTKAQGESLVFDVRAIAPGTKIPVYDADLKPVLVDGVQKVFEADEDFLKRSVALFDGGHLNRDHLADTDFGDLTKAFYDGGLCFSGMCSSPDDIELISGGKYNGWSIEGEFVATETGDALKPTRLSLLTEKDPACPSNRCDTLRMALAAATTEAPLRDDWNNWGHFSIRGKDDESVSLNCYLPDIDFGDGTEIKSMDVVDPDKFRILAQYIVNTVLGVASGNQGAVVMASEPKPGEPGTVDPFASIKEKFGVESEDELKTLIEHGRKYADVTTKLDGIKTERDELRTAKTELETNLTALQERQRQRDIAEAKEKVKTAFVPGLWEGEIEEEVEGGEKVKIAKVDRMAEDYVKDPAGFYAANRTFALAERPLEPKTKFQGSAASTEADEMFAARRAAVDKNMQRSGR